MEQSKFEAVLSLLVPQVLTLIAQNRSCDEVTAAKSFYSSELYFSLEKEETKLWHLSAPALFELYKQEISAGHIDYPEEA